MVKLIKMAFGQLTWISPISHVLDGKYDEWSVIGGNCCHYYGNLCIFVRDLTQLVG